MPARGTLAVAAAIVAALTVVVQTADSMERRPASGNKAEQGRIAFERTVFLTSESGSDRTDVWVMNADGSRQRNLTGGDQTFLDGRPDWSPNGQRIAFTSFRGPGPAIGIYTMKPDGSDVRRLTRSRLDSWNPSWSPDGRLIAFDSQYQADPQSGIYVMNADGSGTRRLTQKGVVAAEPDWSPDGRKILFRRDPRGRAEIDASEIYVMNADGSGTRRLTRNHVDDLEPRWSPDGRSIAYYRIGKPAGIYVMRPDGKAARRIIATIPGEAKGLAWSPDGTQIAFVSKDDLYVIQVERRTVQRLTRGDAWESSPTWTNAS
jgi:TolB protein